MKRKLASNILTQKVFFGVNILVGVVSIATGVGAVAGAAITAGLTFAEKLATQQLGSIDELYSSLQKSYKSRHELLDAKLSDILKLLHGHSDDDLNTIKQKLKDTKMKIKEAIKDGKTLDPAAVEQLNQWQKESADLLQKKKDATKDVVLGKVLDRGIRICKLAMTSLNDYNKIKDNEKQMDKYEQVILLLKKQLERLEMQERMIYDTMIPLLKDTREMLEKLIRDLQNATHAELDVGKWKVHTELRDVD